MRTLSMLSVLAVVSVALAAEPYGDISDLKLANPLDKVGMEGPLPPKGAVVLFDGKSLDNWVKARDKNTPPAEWKLVGGAMQVQGGDIMSKQKFDGSFRLHVEFRVPYMPDKMGQGRGNSGVYVQGRYEVQVLDSYGLKSKDNDCGGIYSVAAPLHNVCKAPTVWQAYDIEFHAPKCKDGKPSEAGRMTVYHNGVKIHDDVKLVQKKDGQEIIVTNTTSGLGGDPCTPGPIMLQDHGNPVQFRNIWVLPMK